MKAHLRMWLLPCLLAAAPVFAADEPVAKAPNFVRPAELDLTVLLPPPPAMDSTETKAELATLRELQKIRSPERAKIAEEDNTETVFEVVRDQLGPNFAAENLPTAATFFKRLLSDEGIVVDTAKAAWARPRPFLVDSTLVPCPPAKKYGAYPSGHATVGYLSAIVLSEMVPERRPQIFSAAARYAESRLICGVHYPSDIAASRAVAAVMAVQVHESPQFQKEFAAAKAEVRSRLGLTTAAAQ